MQVAWLGKAQADVAKAEERRRYALSDLGRSRKLLGGELISRRSFEEAQERADVRQRELEAAEAELRMMSADDLTTFRKELAVAEEEVQEARARLQLLEAGNRPEEIEATEVLACAPRGRARPPARAAPARRYTEP
jgi:multidrug resistance efflux pump